MEDKRNSNMQAPSVMDMVESYANETNIPVDDIFKTPVPSTPATPANTTVPVQQSSSTDEWQPDAEDTDDLPELNNSGGVVYDKSEIKTSAPNIELSNLLDDQAAQAAVQSMDELQRAEFNITRSKQRLGIKHLNIPTIYTSRVMDYASDNDITRCAPGLDALLGDIINLFPEAVVEWLPGRGPQSVVNPKLVPPQPTQTETAGEIGMSAQPPSVITNEPDPTNVTPIRKEATPINPSVDVGQSPDLTVIIDKSQASDVAFNTEELEKIRKSRSVELKIVEDREMKYNIIDDPINDIDQVLSQYTRRFNDIPVSLPASHYRCTITGLSYPEILDLSYSHELNNLEGERKKWSIAYAHVTNASIGAFADFDDFLQKTSFMDLDFILWAVLCATSMSNEIVSIDCHGKNCHNSYDWVYSPKSLLQLDKIPAQTLEEMRITGEATTVDEIRNHYNESMLRLSNSIELPTSKFVICFGHISAYTYLNDIYGKIETMRNQSNAMASDAFGVTALTIIKYILLPKADGSGHYKISNPDDMLKIFNTLNEIDFQAVTEMLNLMTDPYQLTFALNDIICSKCKLKSSIKIDDISRLLFIVARSLSNVNVVLTRQ